MSLLSKFSKVEKNFLGQCDCLTWHKLLSLQNPALFRILAFSRIYEVPTVVKGNTTDHYDLLTTLKENSAPVKPTKTKRSKEHFCVGNGCIFSFLVFLENTSFHIEKAPWKTTALWSLLSYLSDTLMGKRFLVAELRNHEGKPYFRDIERKVWLFYEINCHRKAPSKTGFSPHCFRLKYGSNLTWTLFLMIVSRVNATICEM